MRASDDELMDDRAFAERLREVGARRYHDRHPYHLRMNAGGLSPGEVRTWVANRFEYQRTIPRKDAAILANCPIREVRVNWARRIADHDGTPDSRGGIEAWLTLAEATGLTRDEVLDGRHVVPGVKFASAAYLEFARSRLWPIAVASSLTELFAPDLMSERIAAFRTHYAWVPAWGLEYFEGRPPKARRDSGEAMELTLTHCDTPTLRQEAVEALAFKCDVLWAILDATAAAPEVEVGSAKEGRP
jgi:pyrroloquinoline-quinone synthase